LAELDVRLVFADDLVGHGLLAGGVEELDRRAEDHAPVVVEERGVDDLRIRELRLELDDPSFDEALAFTGGLVLGVLRDVALGARFRDRGDHRRAVLGLQPVQLGAQLVGADERDGYLHVDGSNKWGTSEGSDLWSVWISYGRSSVSPRMPRQAARAPAMVV